MKIRSLEVKVVRGDITEVKTEAVVNPANDRLVMGGGVALAIKKKGGKIIEEEAKKLGPKSKGEAVLTSAGDLKAKYVIHTVTMGMDFVTDEETIRKATWNALMAAEKFRIKSLSFPALGCGTGKFPFQASAKIMAQEVWRYTRQIPAPSLKKIIFVLNSQKAYLIFKKNVSGYLEYIEKKVCSGPFLTVDGIVEYRGGIVMVERSNPPFGWALPGGFLDYGETVEEAVKREVKEETNLEFVNFKELGVYSQPERDPRFHTVSVVFVGKGKGSLKADSDAKAVKVFKIKSLPSKIAFDHRRIIEDYTKSKSKI